VVVVASVVIVCHYCAS